MIEDFEYKGIWWLPSEPKEKISGTLKFIPGEGAVLELIGSFKDIRNFNTVLVPEIILGSSSNGKNITLHKCFETHSSFSSSGFLISSFYANVVLVGAHFQKNEDVRFRSMSVHLSYLDEWINISGFDIQTNKDEVIIKYKPAESIEATVKDDCKVFVDTRTTYPKYSIVQKEATIKQLKYVRIVFSEEKSLDEYLKVLSHIQNFLSLGIKKPTYPLTIEVETEANKMMLKDNKPYYPPVELFYALRDIPKVSDTLMPFDMLFSFKDISHSFEFFLKNWFEKAELLEPVYNLYFGTLYNPRMYLHHGFLSLVQAVESYHRRVMKNYELPEEEHNKRLEGIFNTVLEEHKKWLKSKLAYSNEPTLLRRLVELLDKYSEIADSFIGDRKSFVHKVVATRNYLTHYDSSLKGQAIKGEELYHVSQKLKALLEMCLLTELGFNFDNIKDIFARNRRYKFESHK